MRAPLRQAFVVVIAIAAVTASTLSSVAAAPQEREAASTESSAGRPDAVPLVIGHRGASGYRPEHTLASYELAARMGADFIEPDLVSTKDGVLIARHENDITGTTDVADHPEFAARKTTKTIDGTPATGWFSEDFTLAEIKTIRAEERLPLVRQENTIYDGLFQIPTFDEVLDLRSRLSRELRREIGVYPETKHPTFFRERGLSLEPPLVRSLKKAGLNRRSAPVFIQSFERTNLAVLRNDLNVKTKLVFLTSASGSPFGDTKTYAQLTTPAGLAELAATIDGIGPDKLQVIPRNAAGKLESPTTLVADAHRAGLLVHPYTFRAENQFLPTDYRRGAVDSDYGQIIDEMTVYLRTGIDGFFTDQPDIGVLARDTFVAAS